MSAADSHMTPAATAAGARTIELVVSPPQARPLTAAERKRAAANALASTRAEGVDLAEVEPPSWRPGYVERSTPIG